MKPFRINPELLALIQSNSLESFTVPELTAAYRNLPNRRQKTSKAAQQFVSRNVIRLTKKGLLEIVAPPRGKQPRFRYRGLPYLEESTPTSSQPTAPSANTDVEKTDELQSLNERLQRYNLEMLQAIGETAEYGALCKEFPHLRGFLRQRYDEARDQCSKMLGRVRALESVIQDRSQAPQP